MVSKFSASIPAATIKITSDTFSIYIRGGENLLRRWGAPGYPNDGLISFREVETGKIDDSNKFIVRLQHELQENLDAYRSAVNKFKISKVFK